MLQSQTAVRCALGCAVLVTVVACDAGPQSAPYVAPTPGTVYDYGQFTNTITAADGWRVRFSDNQGRQAERIGVFLTGDVEEPLQVEAAALDSLWPLEPGREAAFETKRGPEVWRWELRVTEGEEITVPAGTFQTLLVQGVQTPELVRNPQAAATVAYSWWYAPEINSVVRYRTTYMSGPAQGRVVEGELRGITAAAASGSAARPAADSATPPSATPGV